MSPRSHQILYFLDFADARNDMPQEVALVEILGIAISLKVRPDVLGISAGRTHEPLQIFAVEK